MLEEKNLISLKDAAKLSGYSPDYVGQLIRSGKIPGKQVYCNIAWMTTAEAVLSYKNKGKNEKERKLKNIFRKISMQYNILKLFFRTFKSAFPILITLIISFIILSVFFIYSLYNSADTQNMAKPIGHNETITF